MGAEIRMLIVETIAKIRRAFLYRASRSRRSRLRKLTSIIVAVASGVDKGSGARQRRRHDRKKISLDARESRARVKEAIDRGYMGAI